MNSAAAKSSRSSGGWCRYASVLLGALLLSAAEAWVRPARKGDQVIAYCAQDQVYAEPILREFAKQTGIKVRAVYDSEAVKTVGLANRLLAERRIRSATCSGATKRCARANWPRRASSARPTAGPRSAIAAGAS